MQPPLFSRRNFLGHTVAGVGGIALAWLLDRDARASEIASPYAAKPPHFPAKAKRVIHICALGGVSHLDSFDYKPELARRHGQDANRTFDTFFGQPGKLFASPFEFRQHGQCGRAVSNLMPHISGVVDELTFIHSMHSKSSNHTPATFLMNTGFTLNGFPNFGSWISYGLGSENQDLPAYIVIPDPRQVPAGGTINWTSGFLPPAHQGVAFRGKAGLDAIPDLATPAGIVPAARADAMQLLEKWNAADAAMHPGDSALAARIRAYELAAQMQTSVPDLVDLKGETEATKKLYGLDQADSARAGFARNCLLARRLSERGVRFVQVFNGGAFASPRINWDGHEDCEANHREQAAVMDQPVAALIRDLRARGLLNETLVLWSTEFGRTPITQGIGSKGRDHHPGAFTIFMAGAGLRPGTAFGSTDDIGYAVQENPVEFYNVHATMLHLLGLDHERLVYYHNGTKRRLTDVHGSVIRDILAT